MQFFTSSLGSQRQCGCSETAVTGVPGAGILPAAPKASCLRRWGGAAALQVAGRAGPPYIGEHSKK